MEAPKPPATPSRMLFESRCSRIRSPAPSPFWMVRIKVSGPIIDAALCAADPTPEALVAMTTRSHIPTEAPSIEVRMLLTVRSPLAPSTRKPWLAMASTCSFQRSIAQISFPESARRPA